MSIMERRNKELIELENELKDRLLDLFELEKEIIPQPKRFDNKSRAKSQYENKKTDVERHFSQSTYIKAQLDELLRFGGMVVREHSSDACSVVFNINLKGIYVAQYAVRMRTNGDDEWYLEKYHLPIGFQPEIISSVAEVMSKKYFNTMHRALQSHHDRLFQIEQLKEILPFGVQLLNSSNGSYIELVMRIQPHFGDQKEIIDVSIELRYNSLDCRPTSVDITKFGISHFNDIKKLKIQLNHFHLCALPQAFLLSFRDGENLYYSIIKQPIEFKNNLPMGHLMNQQKKSFDNCNHTLNFCNNLDHNENDNITVVNRLSDHNCEMVNDCDQSKTSEDNNIQSVYKSVLSINKKIRNRDIGRYDPNDDSQIVTKKRKTKKNKISKNISDCNNTSSNTSLKSNKKNNKSGKSPNDSKNVKKSKIPSKTATKIKTKNKK